MNVLQRFFLLTTFSCSTATVPAQIHAQDGYNSESYGQTEAASYLQEGWLKPLQSADPQASRQAVSASFPETQAYAEVKFRKNGKLVSKVSELTGEPAPKAPMETASAVGLFLVQSLEDYPCEREPDLLASVDLLSSPHPQTAFFCELTNWQADQELMVPPQSSFVWGQEFMPCEALVLKQIQLNLAESGSGRGQMLHLFLGVAEELPGQGPIASSYHVTHDGRFLFQPTSLEANQTYTFVIENGSASPSTYWVSAGDTYQGGRLLAFPKTDAQETLRLASESIPALPEGDLCFRINPTSNQILENGRSRRPVHSTSFHPHHRRAQVAWGEQQDDKDPSRRPVKLTTPDQRWFGQANQPDIRRP